MERTSLYLHVPFCRNCCPYCPYTKVPYDEMLVEPYTRAALAEVDWWADTIGPAEITSIYIGGGTPTLALGSVTSVLKRVRHTCAKSKSKWSIARWLEKRSPPARTSFCSTR